MHMSLMFFIIYQCVTFRYTDLGISHCIEDAIEELLYLLEEKCRSAHCQFPEY